MTHDTLADELPRIEAYAAKLEQALRDLAAEDGPPVYLVENERVYLRFAADWQTATASGALQASRLTHANATWLASRARNGSGHQAQAMLASVAYARDLADQRDLAATIRGYLRKAAA